MPQLPSYLLRASKEFRDIRRQRFMYWEAYESILESLDEGVESDTVYFNEITDLEKLDLGFVSVLVGSLRATLDRISLEYTAAAPIEELKGLYPAAVDAFEAWCFAYRDWSFHEFSDVREQYEAAKIIPCQVKLEIATSYLELLRLLSLGVLFNEQQQLQRIAKLIQSLRGQDTIIEELLMPFVPDGQEINEFCHLELYDLLIGAAWEEDTAESAKCMTQFLKSWYKFFEGAPWHDAHLRFGDLDGSPDWANYYGYWAWEAGAIAYLYELDDSSYRSHILYPKDLVDWARQQGKPPKTYVPSADKKAAMQSVLPGQVCPKTGTWVTTALLKERSVYVNAGDLMPKTLYDKSGNAVIWHLKDSV